MGVLMWDKPMRMMPAEDWLRITADSAPPGVYTPNMSGEDRLRWKARLVGTRSGDPRVEIRKTFSARYGDRGYYAQMLIIVWPSKDGGEASHVRMSLNGTADADPGEWVELMQAVGEAQLALANLRSGAEPDPGTEDG